MTTKSKIRLWSVRSAMAAIATLAATAGHAAPSVVAVDWGNDPSTLQNSFRTISGAFSELFLFSLTGPNVGSFSATAVAVTISGLPLYSLASFNMALYSSGIDGTAATADDVLVATATTIGNLASLESQSLGAGSYFVKVNGTPNGVLGGAYVTTALVSAVPEPESYALFLAGLGALGFLIRRRGAVPMTRVDTARG